MSKLLQQKYKRIAYILIFLSLVFAFPVFIFGAPVVFGFVPIATFALSIPVVGLDGIINIAVLGTLIVRKIVLMVVFPVYRRLRGEEYFYFDTVKKSSRVVPKLPPQPENTLRFVCVSDTHDSHEYIPIPEGDVLVHCGDILIKDCSIGSWVGPGLQGFNDWLKKLPSCFKYKLIVAGNHDFSISKLGKDKVQKILSAGKYLGYVEHEKVSVEGIKIFGSPISPWGTSDNNAFQQKVGTKEMVDQLKNIPGEIDILITHGSPFSWGSSSLTERVAEVSPELHIFGHIHKQYGVYLPPPGFNTTSINASSLNGYYLPVHPPIVFDYRLK